MKKAVSLFLVLVLAFSLFSVNAFANGTSTFDLSSDVKRSLLSISGTTATCTSTYSSTSSTISKITAKQTLEKHWAFGIFNPVDNDSSWTKSVNSSNLSMTNTKSGLGSGTYRLKTEFTITTTSGKTETVTVYSDEKTI